MHFINDCCQFFGNFFSQKSAFERTLQVNRVTNGGDASAVEVLKLVIHLRKVFLEDAVYRREKYPDFPAYKHKVFSSPLWSTYATEEKKRVEAREQEWKQKDADLLFKVNELQQGQVDTATALQGLHEKLEHIVQNGISVSTSTGANEQSPPGSSSGQSSVTADDVLPLPPLPKVIADIREFYITWHNNCRHQYVVHKEKHRMFKWKDVYGKHFQIYKQRYYKAESFLTFLDELDDAVEETPAPVQAKATGPNMSDDVGFGKAVNDALCVMEEFIEENNVSAASMVTYVFRKMIKGDIVVDNNIRLYADALKGKLLAAGFDIPSVESEKKPPRKRKL